jgi:hypothetical protein
MTKLNLPSSVPNATGATAGTLPVANGSNSWTVRDVLPADVGIDLTTSVQAADIGAASQTAFSAHTSNYSNPHQVTPAQVGITAPMLSAITALANGSSVGGSTGGLSSGLLLGNGSDGVIVFDGTTTYTGLASLTGSVYTLIRDVNLATGSTVNSGVQLETGCGRIFCTGELINNGTISANGQTATGQSGKAYSLVSSFSGLARPVAGGAGGNNGNGTAGAAGFGGGGGGTGGVKASYTAGAGGTVTAVVLPHNADIVDGFCAVAGAWIGFGRGGGGGGTGDGTNAGGGGGTGGGLLLICAQTFANNGTLQSLGGAGAAALAGNAAGGGGGGGGQIVVVTLAAISGSGTNSTLGGAGGAGFGTGSAGATGSTGSYINLVLPLDAVTGNPYSWAYGDGSDGVCTFDGTTTFPFASLSGGVYKLTRDCYLADGSSVASGVTIMTGYYDGSINYLGYRLFCKGTMTNNGTLSNNGLPGSQTNSYVGNNLAGVIAGPTRPSPGASGAGTAGYSQGGGPGGGAAGGGGLGTSAASRTNSQGGSWGGSMASTVTGQPIGVPHSALAINGWCPVNGAWAEFGAGGGGGGGNSDGTNIAGSGGGGGGLVMIVATVLINNGIIESLGDAGGSCTGGAVGGGGGGGGGMILIITSSPAIGSGTTNSSGGAGGIGTNTAAGHGSITAYAVSNTADGNNGSPGAVLNLLVA